MKFPIIIVKNKKEEEEKMKPTITYKAPDEKTYLLNAVAALD